MWQEGLYSPEGYIQRTSTGWTPSVGWMCHLNVAAKHGTTISSFDFSRE